MSLLHKINTDNGRPRRHLSYAVRLSAVSRASVLCSTNLGTARSGEVPSIWRDIGRYALPWYRGKTHFDVTT